MTELRQECEVGRAVKISAFTRESRRSVLPRLYGVFASTDCRMVSSERRADGMEYVVEIQLAAALELYCGLMQAGVQMIERSHRALTELCLLLGHESALEAIRRPVSVHLVMSFVHPSFDVEAVEAVTASS